MIMIYWSGGAHGIELEFNSEKACHEAAVQINKMLHKHIVAAGQSHEQATELLAKDYVCVPKG